MMPPVDTDTGQGLSRDEGTGEAARFTRDLAAPGFTNGRLGLAVSGGPDSVALMLLAHAALPGRIAVATVDHGLRPEAAEEAAFVAGLCAERGVPHAILPVTVAGRAGPQGNARTARYAALADWAARAGLAAVATAHHADDQAETLLLRLARGAGVAGLAGARATIPLNSFSSSRRRPGSTGPHDLDGEMDPGLRRDDEVSILRPLLGWRRAELAAVVARAGIATVADPSNADPRYGRTQARALLAETGWLDPARLAASAAHLGEAEAALGWAAGQAWAARATIGEGGITLDPAGLPDEIVRRLLLRAIAELGGETPDGPSLARLMTALAEGGVATLSGIRADGRLPRWRLAPAPPRRNGS